MIQETEHFGEWKKVKRNESTAASTGLVEAGAQMIVEALNRTTTLQGTLTDVNDQAVCPGSNSSLVCRRLLEQSVDDQQEILFIHAERQEQRELNSLRLEEIMLEMEKQHVLQDSKTVTVSTTFQQSG